MKNLNIKFIALFLAGAAVIGCDDEFDNAIEDGGVYTSGEADFSKFVTVGNSLTAGFADNALYLNGQLNSYPNIIAGQMQFAGGGEFNQPLVNDNAGGLLAGGVQILPNRFVLASDGNGTPAGPVVLDATPTTDITNKVTGPLNNFGVPGARVFHLAAPGYGSLAGVAAGTANPYYARFSSSESSTVIEDAVAANGTFFTLWIGNNDILGYATSGGSGVDNNELNNIDPAAQGDNSITNNNVFAGVYQQLVAGLTANGAKGALVNIPDVTSIPFFTTVPSQALSPLDPSFGPQIPLLNQVYGGLNQIFVAFGQPERQISFSTTAASGLVVRDNDLADLSQNPSFVSALVPLVQGIAASFNLTLDTAQATGLAQILAPQFGQIRQATPSDLITFTAASLLGGNNQQLFGTLTGAGVPVELAGALTANGITFPLGDEFVLDDDEQDAVTTAQTAYNATIEALATANGLAYVDVRTALSAVATTGVSYNGGVLTSTYASGGAFSLDAVHPTPRGYALTANTIIDAINAQYSSTLPKVDIGAYDSVQVSDSF
ncbi:SGNH/GDSL hydrolase family protein [Nonlabens sp.]|uniref:SGNH/GDSL hydrolase family protein n=1 Tax=Nonlabens sp. TaxID=1888209 RepID=UPI00326676A5